MRLSQTARKLNVGTETIVNYLKSQGIEIENKPNLKLTAKQLVLLEKEFSSALTEKQKAESIVLDLAKQEVPNPIEQPPHQEQSPQEQIKSPSEPILEETSDRLEEPKLVKGLTMLGKLKIDNALKEKRASVAKFKKIPSKKTTKTKPVILRSTYAQSPERKNKKRTQEIGKRQAPQVKRAKYQKEKKERFIKTQEIEQQKALKEEKILRVTEFITVHQLAALVNLPVANFLSVCMDLGIIASINQRLDPETIIVIADELGFEVKFVKNQTEEQEEIDSPEDLLPRPPVVTVMGHVDHGKTTLLDYIRKTQVVATEAGSITQHMGAYEVHTKDKKTIVFLDTPGHEAFTAMRARGVQLTDIAIIIVAADDGVMPQTKEAISHAQLANTPIVIAINKVDKPGADPQKVKEQLSQLNLLVEDWGGKYQCQEISAKKGQGIDQLLEKISLEAELLSLTANPNKKANGIVIEASLDHGRGYLATLMVKGGTLNKGDFIVTGPYFGRIKNMFDSKGTPLKQAMPSIPVQVLGLNGAPSAGQNFIVTESKQKAREKAATSEKMLRTQRFRVQHTVNREQLRKTLETHAIPELNLLIKGDVDGSVEALADALLKLATEKLNIKIIYKAVGPISESDVILAAASNAIVIGFQTKLSTKARLIANNEKVDIQLYTIIYDAIDYVKSVVEDILTPPQQKETIIGRAEVTKTFTFPGIGTIAGCKVLKGTIHKDGTLRCIRKEKILYTGPVKELQQKGQPVQQAKSRSECGINFANFNDILVGDIIEEIQP